MRQISANYAALFYTLKDRMHYPVFVDVHRSQVTIKEQLVRLNVDGTLPPAFAAEGPLRIYQAPERRSCKKRVAYVLIREGGSSTIPSRRELANNIAKIVKILRKMEKRSNLVGKIAKKGDSHERIMRTLFCNMKMLYRVSETVEIRSRLLPRGGDSYFLCLSMNRRVTCQPRGNLKFL